MPYPSKPSPRHQLDAVSPQPIPSRRCRRFELPAGSCCHAPAVRSLASTRPQGLVPMTSPLLLPGVATSKRLVAPLGLFPSKLLFCTRRRADPREGRRLAAVPNSAFPRDCDVPSSRPDDQLRHWVAPTSEEVRARPGASASLALREQRWWFRPRGWVALLHLPRRQGVGFPGGLSSELPAEAGGPSEVPGGSLSGAGRSRCLSASRWALQGSTEVGRCVARVGSPCSICRGVRGLASRVGSIPRGQPKRASLPGSRGASAWRCVLLGERLAARSRGCDSGMITFGHEAAEAARGVSG
jgi:hypothetical protein